MIIARSNCDQAKAALSLLSSLFVVFNHSEFIWLGSAKNKGGYLVPPDIFDCDMLISPGVGDSAEFEKAFWEKGKKVILIDKIIKCKIPRRPNVKIIKSFVGPMPNSKCVNLNQIILKSNAKKICLQMDIEGWEWPVLSSLSNKALKKIHYLVIELHGLSCLMLPGSFPQASANLNSLLQKFQPMNWNPNFTNDGFFIGNQYFPDLVEICFKKKYNRSTQLASARPV